MKYKIGDKVVCIEYYPVSEGFDGGQGWELGRILTVTAIEDSEGRPGQQILWGLPVSSNGTSKGIYSNWVELYNELEIVIKEIKEEIGITD
jgi:hypothetical protein